MAGSIAQQWDEGFKTFCGYGVVSPRAVEALMKNEYVRALSQFLRPDDVVLEAGCGSAKFSLTLAAMGFRVVALDYSPTVLKNVAESRRRLSQVYDIDLELVRGDIEHFSFDENTFDLVFNEGVVEHWLKDGERLRIFREMARISRRLVGIIVPNGRHFMYDRWMRAGYPGYTDAPPMTLYDISKLSREMAKAGLDVVYRDGVDPWSFVNFWPRARALAYPKMMLSMLPLPRSVREEWGINLLGIGRKTV